MRREPKSESRGPRRGRNEPMPRRRSRHLDGVKDIDIHNHDLLRQFVTEHGKVLPARLTGASAKQQRQLKKGIRRARVIGVIA